MQGTGPFLREDARAERRRLGGAERLAREAVEVLGEADAPLIRVDALVDLAEVLTEREPAEAKAVLDDALELCRRKAMAVPTVRVQTLLAPFEQTAQPAPRTVARF